MRLLCECVWMLFLSFSYAHFRLFSTTETFMEMLLFVLISLILHFLRSPLFSVSFRGWLFWTMFSSDVFYSLLLSGLFIFNGQNNKIKQWGSKMLLLGYFSSIFFTHFSLHITLLDKNSSSFLCPRSYISPDNAHFPLQVLWVVVVEHEKEQKLSNMFVEKNLFFDNFWNVRRAMAPSNGGGNKRKNITRRERER